MLIVSAFQRTIPNKIIRMPGRSGSTRAASNERSTETSGGPANGAQLTALLCLFFLMLATPLSALAQLPLGSLAQDGAATPEQLSLILPVNGSLAASATAEVRYKPSSGVTWATAHPLYRIQPEYSQNPAVGDVVDAFAWPIIGLSAGTTYNVEVTVTSDGESQVVTGTFSTRSLPGNAGAATVTIGAGTGAAQIQSAINSLSPGDVLVFENGRYDIDGLSIGVNGTSSSPIFIRGESRGGVVLADESGAIITWQNASNVVLENLTLQGSGADGGTSNFHHGMFGPANSTATRLSVRNVTITGVNQGIVFDASVNQTVIYNSTIIGNNRWSPEFIDSNLTWNDDGIRVPGSGNAVFNNTITGFGDSLSIAAHSGSDTLTEAIGTHFYRNDVRNSGDDFIEADHAHRNITFYDNRSHNSMTFLSLDPLYGGPLLVARNVAINIGRTPHKWNSTNSGQFVYNNTLIIGETDSRVSGWYQPNNGPQRAYGYRNNILIYRGSGTTLWIESSGHDPIDFTHNCWYPDRQIQWGGVWASIAQARSGISPTMPIFSGESRRFSSSKVCERDPFATNIDLGLDYHTEISTTPTARLSSGSSPKNSGVVISNITDGYSGDGPDMGAIISGRPGVVFGDPTIADVKIPSPPTQLSTGN